jgi:hypothetical protein
MFSLKKKAKINDLEIRFHREAAGHGQHGQIRVSNRRLGLEDKVVNFVIVGMIDPPQQTPALFQYIWDEAKAQGYMPSEFVGTLLVNRRGDPAEAETPVQAYDARDLPAPARLLGGATLVSNDRTDPQIGHQSAGFEAAERQAAERATANS